MKACCSWSEYYAWIKFISNCLIRNDHFTIDHLCLLKTFLNCQPNNPSVWFHYFTLWDIFRRRQTYYTSAWFPLMFLWSVGIPNCFMFLFILWMLLFHFSNWGHVIGSLFSCVLLDLSHWSTEWTEVPSLQAKTFPFRSLSLQPPKQRSHTW